MTTPRPGRPVRGSRTGRPLMAADQVAAAGLRTLFAGKLFVIPGLTNKVSAQLNRFFPRKMALKIAKGMFEKQVTSNEKNAETPKSRNAEI